MSCPRSHGYEMAKAGLTPSLSDSIDHALNPIPFDLL